MNDRPPLEPPPRLLDRGDLRDLGIVAVLFALATMLILWGIAMYWTVRLLT